MANDTVVVHWRPGCGYCRSLLRGLEASPMVYDTVDIWQDERAAAFVRRVNGGNETVPTVRVGDVAVTNPSLDELLRVVAEHAPGALPSDYEPPRGGRVARAVTRILGG